MNATVYRNTQFNIFSSIFYALSPTKSNSNSALWTCNGLVFDPEDNLQGIFFINEDGTEIRVDVVGQNQASVLRFIIPQSINAGEYNIEIRNKPGNKLRKGQMEESLTVAA